MDSGDSEVTESPNCLDRDLCTAVSNSNSYNNFHPRPKASFVARDGIPSHRKTARPREESNCFLLVASASAASAVSAFRRPEPASARELRSPVHHHRTPLSWSLSRSLSRSSRFTAISRPFMMLRAIDSPPTLLPISLTLCASERLNWNSIVFVQRRAIIVYRAIPKPRWITEQRTLARSRSITLDRGVLLFAVNFDAVRRRD